ncbi:MAG: hypothetical protein IJJ99_03650 [Oscillospiraceae bacterium]|nr:hypothetical protein [Oscillospiraceae bacterium]
MKRLFCLLLVFALLLTLAACGGNRRRIGDVGMGPDDETQDTEAQADPTGEAAQYPVGLFMLRWIGDENGEYVPKDNEFEDYYGNPITLLEEMYENNSTLWCEIGEDGTGTVTLPFGSDPQPIDFNTDEAGKVQYGDYLVPYYTDETGAFWFSEDDTLAHWYVLEPCSQERLDLVFNGIGGSVPLKEAKVGDLVCMGQYIQDEYQAQLSPIYWRVIAEEDGKVLLLCDRLLDSFAYNTNPAQEVLTDVTWENCSLRAFLNDESENGFLSMFTPEERALMLTTHLENKAANAELLAQWGEFEDQGEKKYSDLADQNRADDPDTDDRMFLLSYQELLQYFGEPTEEYTGGSDYPFSAMKCNPDWRAYITDAVLFGYYDNATRAGAWMTRTLCNSHTDEDMVVYITSDGEVFDYFTYASMFIRPAVWVSTAAD